MLEQRIFEYAINTSVMYNFNYHSILAVIKKKKRHWIPASRNDELGDFSAEAEKACWFNP